ncbi:hypothetical protein E1A91_A03G089900v1 [Gossypium mustelinum]|uniref:Uncharacterized protein n=1 Tax=Gossypium mustelinum TaxID=34275 RepID=A0A5D2ZUT7_GOSMU|nr:hypothetical protein E1A91_A03G089900v1 [Gossypium mustelinum]
MRSSGNSTVGNDSLLQWNSPLPYLFGGLTIVFGIIGIALLFLACSHWRQSSPELPNAKEEKNNETIQASASMEPKIVVIMAGDDHPRFVAIPCSFRLIRCWYSNHNNTSIGTKFKILGTNYLNMNRAVIRTFIIYNINSNFVTPIFYI